LLGPDACSVGEGDSESNLGKAIFGVFEPILAKGVFGGPKIYKYLF
jgi:hypothetical protein